MKRLSFLVAVLLLAIVAAVGQESGQVPLTIEATATGTGTQLGKKFNINLHIESLSTPEERKTLIDAFTRSGQNGLVSALGKMQPRGRIRMPGGGVGIDIRYIIELPAEKGRRFRLVTERPIAIGEVKAQARSKQYSLGAMELTLTPDGKGSGTLLPACKVRVNKEGQLEVEAYQNPWNLTNFINRD
jgi:hypothetical protein